MPSTWNLQCLHHILHRKATMNLADSLSAELPVHHQSYDRYQLLLVSCELRRSTSVRSFQMTWLLGGHTRGTCSQPSGQQNICTGTTLFFKTGKIKNPVYTGTQVPVKVAAQLHNAQRECGMLQRLLHALLVSLVLLLQMSLVACSSQFRFANSSSLVFFVFFPAKPAPFL